MNQNSVIGTLVRKLPSTVALAALVVVPGILAGCGPSATVGPVETLVTAEVGEYYVKLDKVRVPAGKVTFAVSNAGTMEHEMLIIQTDLAANQLPLGREGDPTRVDEDKVSVSGEVEAIAPARTKSETIELKAGKYLVLCNKPGHFAAGQWIALLVT